MNTFFNIDTKIIQYPKLFHLVAVLVGSYWSPGSTETVICGSPTGQGAGHHEVRAICIWTNLSIHHMLIIGKLLSTSDKINIILWINCKIVLCIGSRIVNLEIQSSSVMELLLADLFRLMNWPRLFLMPVERTWVQHP